MENYPGNSRLPKTNKKDEVPEKKVEKVISGEVVRRKKPLGKRVMETFVGGDDARSVWSYIAYDVLIPAAKDMVSDAVSQGIERMLFGDVRGRSGGSSARSRHGGVSYTNYSRYSSPLTRREPERREMSRRARATHDFDEIVLQTKVEAEEVLDQLYQILSQYEVVTVADLYESVGQAANFTDEKYGWVDLRGANVTRIKGGYLLDLPKPEALD